MQLEQFINLTDGQIVNQSDSACSRPLSDVETYYISDTFISSLIDKSSNVGLFTDITNDNSNNRVFSFINKEWELRSNLGLLSSTLYTSPAWIFNGKISLQDRTNVLAAETHDASTIPLSKDILHKLYSNSNILKRIDSLSNIKVTLDGSLSYNEAKENTVRPRFFIPASSQEFVELVIVENINNVIKYIPLKVINCVLPTKDSKMLVRR